jgi:hypothetical protein
VRWKFAKKDPTGKVVVATTYDASDEASDQVLADLRRFDHLAEKKGWCWSKIPADESPEESLVRTKEWDSPAMNGEPPEVGGIPSDPTYVRRMRNAGIEEQEALRLKRIIDAL